MRVMRALLLLAALAAAPAAAADIGALAPVRSTAPIVVAWPPEGFSLGASEGEFILGSVSDPRAKFRINEQPVRVHPNGAFLAWLSVTPGTFTFRCALDLKEGTTTFDRSILVAAPPPPLPDGAAIDETSLQPKRDMELRGGDWLVTRMRATPGLGARFRLGKRPWVEMREAAPSAYEGALLIEPGASHDPTPIEFEVGSGWSAKKAKSAGRVALAAGTPPIAVVKSATPVYVRTGPGNGFMLFPSSGTRFVTAGRMGSEVKVALSPALSGWIDLKDLDLLPGAAPPRAVAGAINVTAVKGGASVRVGLTDRVPFLVEESDDLSSLTLRLYHTFGHSNWVVYDSSDTLVQQVRWRQEAEGVVAVTVQLREGKTLWGHQASYEGNGLNLEVRAAPRIAPEGSPLWGRTIFLDPGHMPSATGAAGPLGTREMDVNFAIAKAVESLLMKEGAVPIVSRESLTHEVSLTDRPRLAVERKADVYVSLHNNALPDGENPFARPRGYSVFYYHPHSLALARDIYGSFEKKVPLPGEELRYGDLLVARLSSMPAVLVESAYMMFPEQEEKLNDPAFRAKIAEAVVAGLRGFFGKERDRQRRGAKPAKESK